MVITFDDGYAENLALLPLLERYGVRPTVYLCSHLVDTRRHIWSHLNDGGARARCA